MGRGLALLGGYSFKEKGTYTFPELKVLLLARDLPEFSRSL